MELETATQATTAGALEAQDRASIDIAIATAKKYPRDVRLAVKNAEAMATLDLETAEACIYSLPRAGKTIEGPSIRLAEILASCWGNLRIGSRIVAEEDRAVVLQAIAHDLERNVTMTKEVRRRITDKAGRRYNDDMIIMASQAGQSVALRNAILSVVPEAVWGPVYRSAVKALSSWKIPLTTRRDKAITWFKSHGVTEADLMTALGVETATKITEEHLRTLTGVRNQITMEGLDPRDALGLEGGGETVRAGNAPKPLLPPAPKAEDLPETWRPVDEPVEAARPPWTPSDTAVAAEREPGGEG